MRKPLKKGNLVKRPAARTLLAFSLVASLAAFGCTTNRTHGDGEPYVGAPNVGTSPSSSTYGTSVPTTPQPMTSSYRGDDQARVTTTARPAPHRLTADEAALIMADHLPRVRVLGPVNPAGGRGYVSDTVVTGQFVNPAVLVNPQVTINSSISSPPVPAISSGAGGDNASAGAAIFAGNLTTLNPTNSSTAVLPPTMTSSSTIAPSTVAATTAPVTAASTVTSPTTVTTANATPVTVRTLNAAATTGSGNVRVLTSSGRLVVTNTPRR
jgi:hypothetical protein